MKALRALYALFVHIKLLNRPDAKLEKNAKLLQSGWLAQNSSFLHLAASSCSEI